MITFTVDDPMFKTEPLFILGMPWEDFVRYMQTRFDVVIKVDDCPTCVGRCFTLTGPPWRVIWTRDVDLPVILHELFHLVTAICGDRGIVIRSQHADGLNGDETAAYLFEYFLRGVIKRLKVSVRGRKVKV